MIKWIKDFLRYPYDQVIEEVFDTLPKTNCTTPMPSVKPPKDISEPVLSIVKTFSEKGRWKIEGDGGISTLRFSGQTYYFTATDTVTKESYTLTSRDYLWSFRWKPLPDEINSRGLPTWMNDAEKKLVIDTVNSYLFMVKKRLDIINDRQRAKSQKQTKAAQDKERKRLMKLYCGETK